MTVDTEATTTLATTTPEAAVPATAVPAVALSFTEGSTAITAAVAQQTQPAQNIVIAPVYVCKKHEKGVAYITIEGASFCSLCLKRFLERYVKPMTKLETK